MRKKRKTERREIGGKEEQVVGESERKKTRGERKK